MPRKFRLSVKRKYEWKPKGTCHVDVPVQAAEAVSIETPLVVSVPRAIFMNGEAPCLPVLGKRVKEMSILPKGIHSNDVSIYFICCNDQ